MRYKIRNKTQSILQVGGRMIGPLQTADAVFEQKDVDCFDVREKVDSGQIALIGIIEPAPFANTKAASVGGLKLGVVTGYTPEITDTLVTKAELDDDSAERNERLSGEKTKKRRR